MNSNDFLNDLGTADPQIYESILREFQRQEEGLELIASENYVSAAVLEAAGSVLTNKYAEGYPGKRYYGGCEYVDEVERLAIERVRKLFNAQAANVQPHSGSQANAAVYLSLLEAGDKLMGMDLSHGGHLTHGSPVNFSGKLFQAVSYGLNLETERLDYDQIRTLALKEKPKVLVAGASAYSRIIDFEAFGQIAQECGAHLVVDMAHIAGLVAAGLHPSPIPHATFTTSTTHKTLRGPRGGLILATEEWIKKANKLIFPGIQGGPLMHVIAAKAVAFGEGLKPSFKTYQEQVIQNAQAMAEVLLEKGMPLVSGGTDNHLLLLDLSRYGDGEITGKEGEAWLGQAGITVNKNTVLNEKRSPFVTSGLRVGVPAITTRGMKTSEARQVGAWIIEALETKGDSHQLDELKHQVHELCGRFPLYSAQ